MGDLSTHRFLPFRRWGPFLMVVPLSWACGSLAPATASAPTISPGAGVVECASGVCGAVVGWIEHSGEVELGLRLSTPTQVTLRNAHLAGNNTPGCGNGLAVTWLRVDDKLFPVGPAPILGRRNVLLSFFGIGEGVLQMHYGFVDLTFGGENGASFCLRVPIGNADASRKPGETL